MSLFKRAVGVGAILLCVLSSRGLHAGSHLWRINEVFSNADGTVQFVELHEILGAQGELFITHCWFESIATGNIYRFPRNLTEPTGNKYLLLATSAFAALPGAPEPDFIIPDRFFSLDGDTLWYGPAQNYDNFVFQDGDLPTDGVQSIHVVRYAPNTFTRDDFESRVNSPTNFRGETGFIDLAQSEPPSEPAFARGDCNDDGSVNISDAVFLLDALFSGGGQPACQDTCDANDDGRRDIADAVALLVALFEQSSGLPAPQDCGSDPTPDALGCESFSGCA